MVVEKVELIYFFVIYLSYLIIVIGNYFNKYGVVSNMLF